MALLTEEELEVLNHLSEAWNKFIKLPKQHPQQFTEFNAAIHSCQYLVMIRPTVRAEGWMKGDDGHVIPGQVSERDK